MSFPSEDYINMVSGDKALNKGPKLPFEDRPPGSKITNHGSLSLKQMLEMQMALLCCFYLWFEGTAPTALGAGWFIPPREAEKSMSGKCYTFPALLSPCFSLYHIFLKNVVNEIFIYVSMLTYSVCLKKCSSTECTAATTATCLTFTEDCICHLGPEKFDISDTGYGSQY